MPRIRFSTTHLQRRTGGQICHEYGELPDERTADKGSARRRHSSREEYASTAQQHQPAMTPSFLFAATPRHTPSKRSFRFSCPSPLAENGGARMPALMRAAARCVQSTRRSKMRVYFAGAAPCRADAGWRCRAIKAQAMPAGTRDSRTRCLQQGSMPIRATQRFRPLQRNAPPRRSRSTARRPDTLLRGAARLRPRPDHARYPWCAERPSTPYAT